MGRGQGEGPGAVFQAGSQIQTADQVEPPGVPGFRTWRGVYLFVFGFFLFSVLLLALFSRVYS